jgi:O-antigen/teichoic acid export membrane protein
MTHLVAIKRLWGDPLAADSLRVRLARGVFWSLAAAVITQGLAVAASVVTARLLGSVGLGELGMIQRTVGAFGLLAGLGFGTAGTKYVAEFRRTDPARAGRIVALVSRTALVLSVSGAGLLAIFAPFLAQHVLAAPHLVPELQLGCLLLLLNALGGVQTGALAGFEAFRVMTRLSLVRGLVTFPLMIAGVYFGGLLGALAAMIVAAAVGWLLSRAAVAKEARRAGVVISLGGWRTELPILWRFLLPGTLGQAMVGPVLWLVGVMLVAGRDGYAEMGVFTVAQQWWAVLLFAPGVLAQTVLPILSERVGAADSRSSRRILGLSMLANGVIAVPVALVLTLAGPAVMGMYGPAFADRAAVLVAVVWAAALLAIQMPAGQMLAAASRLWLGLATNVAWAAVLIGSFALLRDRGALGMALALLIAYAAHGTWTLAIAWTLTRHGAVLPAPMPEGRDA